MNVEKTERKRFAWGPLVAAILCVVSFLACRGTQGSDASSVTADSLNLLSYTLHYKDLEQSEQAARQALRHAARGSSARAEALNNLAFCAFMQMDFERADSLYAAATAATLSEVERLVADVGRMKISQRTARYKAFCDYRNSARRRLRRITEDASALAPADARRVAYARTELAIASSIYYYYLRQIPQSLHEIESIPVDEALQRDTAQWLYYLYMRGSGDLAPAATPDEVTLLELDYLWPCLAVSYRQGYTYFDANASQALAEMISQPSRYALLTAQRPALMKMLNPGDLSGPELSMAYAHRALEGFERYGDMYQISGALRTMATCLNEAGRHAEALEYLERALQWVNRHHERYYHCTDTLDRLQPFLAADSVAATPVELRWIRQDHILTVPEWIARLREQLSVTCALLGMKRQSDYNRNIYLDLLDYVRQDQETESRLSALQADSRRLNRRLLLLAVGLVGLAIGSVALNRIWRRRNWRYIYRLHHVASLCRRISSSVPEEAAAAQAEMQRLRATFPLKLSSDEQLQAEVLDAYLRWYADAGRQLVALDDSRQCVEKERYVHQRHLTENKQENLQKRACLLVVTGILPYIDRALHTLRRLGRTFEGNASAQEAPSALQKTQADALQYIDELLTRINEYNDILALWIKMKPGALSLHIETFALAPLFEVIAKGRQSFEQRRQTLTVEPTAADVKADKALTLFMLNTLADNARKYTPAGGHVILRATELPDCVELSVIDDGPGLTPSDAARLMSEKRYDAVKGHGFGLMNCRGIIEKYRKTNPFFRVCTFGVDSAPGRGSRFYFRLPKGGKAWMLALLLALRPAVAAQAGALDDANRYAEWVYQSNVDGYYDDALQYADSALAVMNSVVITADTARAALPPLTLRGTGTPAELEWLSAGIDTDYFILLDVRNEAAVACLALGDLPGYRYNNNAYAALYKQLSVDTSLEEYCRRMQRSAGAKTVLLLVALLAVAALTVVSYLRYFRHRLVYRDRLEEVLLQSRRLLTAEPGGEAAPAVDDPFVQRLVDDLARLRAYYAREWMGGIRDDLDAARDEVSRLLSEENRLHVQNRVLDNCLSALKHETVYYPHRIRQWVEKSRADGLDAATVDSMVEMMTYYKEIYTTLTACAARQLDEVVFRRTTVSVPAAMERARAHFARAVRRHEAAVEAAVELQILPADAPGAPAEAVLADEVELDYLLASLLDEALTAPLSGTLRLEARVDGPFVRFTLTDPRRTLSPEALATLFDPHLERMRHLPDERLTGVEYLLGKQVIRDHDAYTGRRGCRMQAEAAPGGGFSVWFTLPLVAPVTQAPTINE